MAAAAAMLAASACVGPTHDTPAYRTHAAVSLDTARSAVAAARIIAAQAERDRVLAPATSVMVRHTEETASHAESVFISRQPPSSEADAIRHRALPLLEEASSKLSEMRIAAYRDDTGRLAELGRELEPLIADLEHHVTRLRNELRS